MINAIKQFLGIGPKADYSQLLKEGAIIIDVRSKEEYQAGHLRNSLNIPLNNLSDDYSKLKKEKAIITCCASGMRSSQAKSILKSKGYEVYNDGNWACLQNKIK